MRISSFKASLPRISNLRSVKLDAAQSSDGTAEKMFVLKNETNKFLDRKLMNTRFQYVVEDKLNSFVVRIIDKQTNKVIKEIPSKELQRVQKSVEKTLGILFDRVL